MNWIIDALLKISPAYLGNMAPALLSRVNMLGLRKPIDGGQNFRDGRRFLGNGKTWQGLVLAILAGALSGWLQSLIGYGSILSGTVLGFGAIFGDLAGSFTKRRLGFKRGENAGLLDSMDFITSALLFSIPFYTWTWQQVVFLLAINPIVHRGANIIGYWIGVKDVPW